MKKRRKIKILKKLYRSGYVNKKISDEAVVRKITKKMVLEEQSNEQKIHWLSLSNLLSKHKISKNGNGEMN